MDTSRSNQAHLIKYFEHPLVNKIKFPDNSTVYEYKEGDLVNKDKLVGLSCFPIELYSHKPTGKMVVAKVVHLSKKNRPTIKLTEIKQLSKLLNELEMVRKLDRKEKCIEIYGLCIDPRKAYLCMEVMDLSLADLKDVMVELENFFDWYMQGVLSYTTFSMVNALNYCWKNQILHRDIKPSNFLLDKNHMIKLSDFGESKVVEGEQDSTYVGTMAYWPPECVKSAVPHDYRADVWSLGITLVELLRGAHPFIERANEDLLRLKQTIETTNGIELVNGLELDDLVEVEFLSKCLSSYEDRPSFEELMETTFYKRGMSTEWINDVHKLIDWKNKLLEILNKDNLEKIYAIIHQPYFPQEENEIDNNASAIFNVGDVVKLKEIGADGWLLGQLISGNSEQCWFPYGSTFDNFITCVQEDNYYDSDSEDFEREESSLLPIKYIAKLTNIQGDVFKNHSVLETVRATKSYKTNNVNDLSFKKGETFEIVEYPEYAVEWWRAKNSKGKYGLISTNSIEITFMNEKTTLNNGWYYSEILNAQEAEMYFINANKGDFVVWDELPSTQYYISVKLANECKHFPIQLIVGNKFKLGEIIFPSLVHLILYYKKFPIFISDINDESFYLVQPLNLLNT